MESRLLPAIARALDEIGIGDRTVTLGRLEFDLCVASVSELDSLLHTRIRELIDEQLPTDVRMAQPARGHFATSDAAHDRSVALRQDTGSATLNSTRMEQSELRRQGEDATPRKLDSLLPNTIHERIDKQVPVNLQTAESASSIAARNQWLIQYLATGLLPWTIASFDRAELRRYMEDAALRDLEAIINESPSDQVLRADAVAFFARLFQLFPGESWFAIADTVARRLPPEFRIDFIEAIRALARSAAVQRPASIRAAANLVAAACASSDSIRRMRLDCITTINVPDAKQLNVELPSDVERACVRLIHRWLGQSPPTLSQTPTSVSELSPREQCETHSPFPASPSNQSNSSLEPAAPTKPHYAPLRRQRDGQDEPFPVAVHHAGLILLHPFLSRFFESTGVLGTNRLVDSVHSSRAAALLAFLATGDEACFEFETVFIKVLVGIPLDVPLATHAESLTDSDRREVDSLLESVIAHWRILQGTSPEGLRTSFLQRPGLLYEEDAGWRLRVESRAFDVLLNHLPWEISVVVLPWMTKPIFTEWMPR